MKFLMPVLMALLLCACPAETTSKTSAAAAGETGPEGPKGDKGDTGDPGLPGQPLRFYLRQGSTGTGPIIYERNRPDLCWPEEVSGYYAPFRYNPDLDACISINQSAVVWYTALNCSGTAYFDNELGPKPNNSYDPEELVRPSKPLKALFYDNGNSANPLQVVPVWPGTYANLTGRSWRTYPAGTCTNVTRSIYAVPFIPSTMTGTPLWFPINEAAWVLVE